jgi:hypothetical protein
MAITGVAVANDNTGLNPAMNVRRARRQVDVLKQMQR